MSGSRDDGPKIWILFTIIWLFVWWNSPPYWSTIDVVLVFSGCGLIGAAGGLLWFGLN